MHDDVLWSRPPSARGRSVVGRTTKATRCYCHPDPSSQFSSFFSSFSPMPTHTVQSQEKSDPHSGDRGYNVHTVKPKDMIDCMSGKCNLNFFLSIERNSIAAPLTAARSFRISCFITLQQKAIEQMYSWRRSKNYNAVIVD